MTENEARQMEVEIKWNGRANVCVHCGKVPETYYITTRHDHTDDSIRYCFCRSVASSIEQLQAKVAELEEEKKDLQALLDFDNARLDQIEDELENVEYLGPYVEGIKVLKKQLAKAEQRYLAWEGGEEWEQLAFQLCADECGEESCNELIWEGCPPEPWGERWLKYESEAKRIIQLVRQYAPDKRAEQRVAEYNELIYAVQTKNPDETRHQTALRYIRNAENRQSNTAANGASS